MDYEITPLAVKGKLDAGERVVLIDVREPFEHQLCHIDGAHLIPMNTIPTQLQNLDGMADEATLVGFALSIFD